MSVIVPTEPDEFARWCEGTGIHTVAVGACDIHGIWRGKRLPVEDFLTRLERGVALSDVVLVLTHAESTSGGEELIEPPGGGEYPLYFPRKEHGFPDVFVRADLSTARRVPWHEGTVSVLGEFSRPSGAPLPIEPRHLLRRIVERARSLGYEARLALEYEFYVLRGDLRMLEASGYQLDPLRIRPYLYGMYGASLDEELIEEIKGLMGEADIWIEAWNPETGPGQFELNLRYADAMRAVDDGFLFKSGVKEILGRRGMIGTFMAKPRDDWAGSSAHVHQSLWDAESGRNAFFDHAAGHGLSDVGRHYIGGLLATMAEFAAMFWPTPNSYKRNAPYSWAGTTVSWGYDNRSTGVRVVADSEAEARIEHRVPGADANPYVAVAACLAGGLLGVTDKIEPPEAFGGDAYGKENRFETLPLTLEQALDRLEGSTLARELLGREFVEFYLVMKRHEAEQYRRHVSEWEVRRYVEHA